MGHPGTTGTDFIDCNCLMILLLIRNEAFFSEKILEATNCYQPTDDKRYFQILTFQKEEIGLPENNFFALSIAHKNNEMFNVWIER